MPIFETGKVYNRKLEIHGAVQVERGTPQGSGNATAGITKVGEWQCVFWNPYKKLYENRWIEEPVEFTYSGEGDAGDMPETGGNADLIRHERTETPVLVFYKVARTGSEWKHLGKFDVLDHERGSSQNSVGEWRRDLRFHLRICLDVDTSAIGKLPEVVLPQPPASPTEPELWAALSKARFHDDYTRRRRVRISRAKRESDPLKTSYVLARVQHFGGACELCRVKPDWTADDGRAHYQAHHLNPDIDAVDWIAGLCGTCHDRLHHSSDRAAVAADLRKEISKRHVLLDRPLSDI